MSGRDPTAAGILARIEADADAFREALGKAVAQLLPLLPPLVRIRLRITRLIDRTACWLVDHERYRLAIALWRAFGLWRPFPAGMQPLLSYKEDQ